MDTWEMEQTKRVGAAVKRLRGKRTAQWLADRAGELGLPMTRQTVTDIENGRRRYISTGELIVIAAALSTAPVALLYPGPYDGFVEVVKGKPVRQLEAADWFGGLVTGLQDVAGQLDPDNAGNMLELKSARAVKNLRAEARRFFSYADQEPDDERRAAGLRADAADRMKQADDIEADMAARRERA